MISLSESGKRPKQVIPAKVWDSVLQDVSNEFFDGKEITDPHRVRQMRDNLSGYLKSLNTGTANGENDPKPELQNIEVLKQLKTSDTYRSKVMNQVRLDLITGPSPKRPKRDSQNVGDKDVLDIEEEAEPDADMTKKASRSRSTLAIESIAGNSLTQTSMQEKFFKEQSEKHDLMKESAGLQLRLKNQMLNKAALEMLILKKQHGLITDEAFVTEASRLI